MDVCPKKLIVEKPASQEVFVACNSHEFGKEVKEVCAAGCIGCGACAKKCEEGAITMDNKLPVIDNEKCIGCMVCVEKCPTKVIKGNLSNRNSRIVEDEKCIG